MRYVINYYRSANAYSTVCLCTKSTSVIIRTKINYIYEGKGIWGKMGEFRRKVVEERGKYHIGRSGGERK
jgi:hypothetical protein